MVAPSPATAFWGQVNLCDKKIPKEFIFLVEKQLVFSHVTNPQTTIPCHSEID